MLPDYVDTKDRLQEVLTRWLRKRVREHLGPLGDVPRYSVFEGQGTSIIRPDEQEDITEMQKLESEFSVKHEEVPKLTFGEILQKLDRVAQEIADDMAKHVYSTISEATERVGNVVNGNGKLIPDTILEVLEKIEIVFNEHGEAEMPSIHIHPNMTETLTEALKTLQETEKYQNKFDEIMLEKKRKSNTKLPKL